MGEGMRIAWDLSHLEFSIEDEYYFSKLMELIKSSGLELLVSENFEKTLQADVAVFNYPEESFSEREVSLISDFIKKGGRAIFLAYYKNEDRVAEHINEVSTNFGIEFQYNDVRDHKNNAGEPFLILTSRIHFPGLKIGRIVLPCTCTLKLSQNAKPLVETEATATIKAPVFGYAKHGNGVIICGGTCVFWDDYSLEKYENAKFSLALLKNKL